MNSCAAVGGKLEVLTGVVPAARSGARLVPVMFDELVPLPPNATLMHLPERRALAMDDQGKPIELSAEYQAVAAVLPVGYLRTLLPASRPDPGAPRLPLFGYSAVVEHEGQLMAAAIPTDNFGWWEPSKFARPEIANAVDAAKSEMPDNRLVQHLSRCALEYNCYTAQNTFYRRYEGALPASPACNADCLGCISLQTDGAVESPQERMKFAPTTGELVELATYHLLGEDAEIISFGQGCEGEALMRDDALEDAVARIRERFPEATIHINTNGSKPHRLKQLIEAGLNSVRISAISFSDPIFRAYYRPVGYTLDEVLECGRVMKDSGGQVCVNLLTFPGITDVPGELEKTTRALSEMGAHQLQWRSLNVDHDWLVRLLPEMEPGIGMAQALARVKSLLPALEHGNFTRPVGAAEKGTSVESQSGH